MDLQSVGLCIEKIQNILSYRNLSSVGGESMCETLVRDDVMTALSAVLRQVSILHTLIH